MNVFFRSYSLWLKKLDAIFLGVKFQGHVFWGGWNIKLRQTPRHVYCQHPPGTPIGEQGWCSGGSTCPPPMWPGFDHQTCHIRICVGWVCYWFSPCSKGFSPGSRVFLPPQKPTFPNSNSIGNSEGHRFVSRKTVKCHPRKIKASLVIWRHFKSVPVHCKCVYPEQILLLHSVCVVLRWSK